MDLFMLGWLQMISAWLRASKGCRPRPAPIWPELLPWIAAKVFRILIFLFTR
ncbi:MAG: hypothetical protein AAF543_19700 [Pseudomonadota bacterium]